jgi:hypothetical protein
MSLDTRPGVLGGGGGLTERLGVDPWDLAHDGQRDLRDAGAAVGRVVRCLARRGQRPTGHRVARRVRGGDELLRGGEALPPSEPVGDVQASMLSA